MKVWSVVVVQRELSSLLECLLVCNLVVMEWTAAITGDCVGLFWDFSPRRKILENHFLMKRNRKRFVKNVLNH
jgi:hypothetical protein